MSKHALYRAISAQIKSTEGVRQCSAPPTGLVSSKSDSFSRRLSFSTQILTHQSYPTSSIANSFPSKIVAS